MIKIQIISLFPEMFENVLNTSMLLKAQKIGAVKYGLVNLRDFGIGPRKQVDDTPYGGGDGMLLRPEPLKRAIDFARANDLEATVLLMTPRGKTWKQSLARQYAAKNKGLIIVCARYEGYDERITKFVDEQISLGNFVLTGGEIPAMAVTDSIVRLLPGVLGGARSAEIESFSDGNRLEYPQYTRPEKFEGMKVPKVLLSGDHAKIEEWRQKHMKGQSNV